MNTHTLRPAAALAAAMAPTAAAAFAYPGSQHVKQAKITMAQARAIALKVEGANPD